MTKSIAYRSTPEFDRDLKRLSKRFRTLPDDLETVKRNVIELYHCHGIDNQAVFRIIGFHSESISFFKVKKFACRAMKGKGVKSGLRLIYASESNADTITLLELYYKGDQVNESRDRMIDHLKRT
jgi:hypothetical protein